MAVKTKVNPKAAALLQAPVAEPKGTVKKTKAQPPEPKAAPAPDKLKELTTLGYKLVEAEEAEARAVQALKDAKEAVRVLAEDDIPQFMKELEIKKITLENGGVLSYEQLVYASITAAAQGAAFAWLEEHGYGGLIKSEVTVLFDREKLAEAQETMAKLKEQGLEPLFARNVHAQTLKAFLRERLEAAEDIPMELFGARAVDTAKVKMPKKK